MTKQEKLSVVKDALGAAVFGVFFYIMTWVLFAL